MVDKDCNNYDKGCKYFHHEPYYTPNNYDLFFDYSSIPVNIPVEKPHDLRNRLQKLMPLTKIIHLNMDNETFEEDNNIHLHTNFKLNFTTEEEPVETRVRVHGKWNDVDETLTSTVNYTVYYSDETPVDNCKIRLINIHNQNKQKTNTTGVDGVCVFEDMIQGTYIRQVLLEGYQFELTKVVITENEINEKIILSTSTIDDILDGGEIPEGLNYYRNGLLYTSVGSYENGRVSEISDENYTSGGFIIVDDVSDDESITILFNSPEFQAINDFSEVSVNILGANNEIVDTVLLNFRNNYTNISKNLPIYNQDNRINYSIKTPEEENFTVDYECIDVVVLKSNEVVLL